MISLLKIYIGVRNVAKVVVYKIVSGYFQWVIRSALPLFQGEQRLVEENIKRNINMTIYPGVFDLAIELSKQGLDGIDYPIDQINEFETEMLIRAIKQEHNV